MADTSAKTRDTGATRGGPVLRPGRPADPGKPAAVAPVADAGGQGAGESAATDQAATPVRTPSGQAQAAPDPDKADAGSHGDQEEQDEEAASSVADSDEFERRLAESYQRKLRRLLRQCERVNLLDFNILALAGWPDNYTLNAARRRRDSWLLSATIAALVFLSGLTGFVPAWIAGGGFGAFVVILLLGVPFVRRLYSPKPSYLDLVLYRQQLLRDARRHVAHLEGEVGLIWQCNELSEFNPTLASQRFSTLRHLSEQRRLAASLTRREHIRLYLIFMLEAEKAYERMQNVYFEGHQKAIDRGWQSVASAVTDPDPASRSAAAGADGSGGDDTAEAVADKSVREGPDSGGRQGSGASRT